MTAPMTKVERHCKALQRAGRHRQRFEAALLEAVQRLKARYNHVPSGEHFVPTVQDVRRALGMRSKASIYGAPYGPLVEEARKAGRICG